MEMEMEIIHLTHPFLRRCINPQALLKNVVKFNTFAKNLERQAKEYAKSGHPKDKEKMQNEYKGWGFELFGEALVKMFSVDKRIGISNYKIVEEDEDYGVDGYGIGINGKPATVQLKYRQANHILTSNKDGLSQFVSNSQNKHGVDLADEKNMLLITSGKDVHYKTDIEMLFRKVRCINREKIRVLVDENKIFWDEFQKSWIAALPKKKEKK